MTTINEGSLQFTFIPICDATKYDEWTFYRRQFQSVGSGQKAVDIICIEDHECWLIEVKDYRRPNTGKVTNLHVDLTTKVRDTLAGLVAAKFNTNTLPHERAFAINVLETNQLHLVFHIEQPEKISKLFPRAIDPADLFQKLKMQLKAIDPHLKIVDQHSMAATMPWTVAG